MIVKLVHGSGNITTIMGTSRWSVRRYGPFITRTGRKAMTFQLGRIIIRREWNSDTAGRLYPRYRTRQRIGGTRWLPRWAKTGTLAGNAEARIPSD